MDLNLTGKKALITGSSGGIGRSIAQALIDEGAQVCLNSRNGEKLDKACREMGASAAVAGDLSLPGLGTKITREAMEKLGGLDILVANTGGPDKGNFLEVGTEQWQRDFQSLWMSLVESLHACLPSMRQQNFGRVLVVTSIAAKEPLPGLTTSNGLRAGLAGLLKSVADEYAAFGITLNLLLPGYTNTDRIKALNLAEEKIKAMVPAGRLGDPSELASLAAFLASERAGYITGQSIAVDGGALRSH